MTRLCKTTSTDLSKVSYLSSEAALNPGDHSLEELKVAPETEGTFWMHVYLLAAGGEMAVELRNSPQQIEIVLSEIHKQQIEDKLRSDEALRLDKQRLNQLNRDKHQKAEEAKRAAKERRRAEIKKK